MSPPAATVAREEVADALRVLRDGGLLLAKGDIGYGLFGTSETAIRRMYELKGRSYSNPCIFIGDLAVLDEISVIANSSVRAWVAELVTWTTCAVVVPARQESPMLADLPAWVRERSVTDGTLAVFLRTGAFLDEVVQHAYDEGWVFVGSSANRSGSGNVFDFDDLPPGIVRHADLALDHGVAAHANPARRATTIVDLCRWRLRRRGVNVDEIARQLEALKREVSVER